jgi:hypothetical protein
MRLKTENGRLEAEVALLTEEIRIKDARLLSWDSRKRPQYPPTERMAILELRAARRWSRRETAVSFHLTPATITHWMRRLDESGPDALVQLPEPRMVKIFSRTSSAAPFSTYALPCPQISAA